MTVAAKFDPRGLLAVFPSTLSFYERTGMDDEHRHTHIQYCTFRWMNTHKLVLLTCLHELMCTQVNNNAGWRQECADWTWVIHKFFDIVSEVSIRAVSFKWVLVKVQPKLSLKALEQKQTLGDVAASIHKPSPRYQFKSTDIQGPDFRPLF